VLAIAVSRYMPWVCSVPCAETLHFAVCIFMPCAGLSRLAADQLLGEHRLLTRGMFAVCKHTAEDIWFLCRVLAHGKATVFSHFVMYLLESLQFKYR
jgi:hypothetical protein